MADKKKPAKKARKPANWNKMPVPQLLSRLGEMLESTEIEQLFDNVDIFEEQQSALNALEDGDELEDEDDIECTVQDLDISNTIQDMEKALKTMKAYQAILDANSQRIEDGVNEHLATCPRCGAKFNRDSID